MDAAMPHLADDAAYADDPVHAAAPGTDEDALTPEEEMAVEHVFASRPFIVEARVWGLPVRYRVLYRRDLLLCNDGAEEATSAANWPVLWGLHALTRAVLDIDGNAPLAPDVTEDTLGARFSYFLGLAEPAVQVLLDRFTKVQTHYHALVNGDAIPKSSGTPDGAGNS